MQYDRLNRRYFAAQNELAGGSSQQVRVDVIPSAAGTLDGLLRRAYVKRCREADRQ